MAEEFVVTRSLKRQLLAELRASWEEGQPIPPEDLLSRWPANPEADPDVASLLSEDYWQRRRQVQQPTSEEYSCRFPRYKDSLARLLEQQALLLSCGGTVMSGSRMLALPVAGDELFGFCLRHEIGRGSYARVFVAEQRELAGRPVVLKVSAIDGDEPQTLAQLQHTHIVPIYSVHEDEQAGLRVVCMPYFGGATLSRVLEALWAETDLPIHGKQLVAALSAVPSLRSPAGEPEQTADREQLSLLARLPYVSAAVWIIARLAEALQHAHQRGVLHRDVKPSNILLCADGQPMLLDFNLAENLQEKHALAVATVGGTVAYMAPEHLRALSARDPALARHVDHRADLYGLGMVLYELLAGRSPFGQNASYAPLPALLEAMAVERARVNPSLRQHRPDAPWSLESITRKCLDPEPANRYQQAEHLAEDLRRYLENRPLKYAPELSCCERMVKWRRRHPRLAATGWMAGALAVLLAAGSAILFSALKRAHEGDGAIARQTMQSFFMDAGQARCFLNTTIGEHAPPQLGLEICERALRHYKVLQRADWQEQVVWQRLNGEERRHVASEICELLMLLARARVMRAKELKEGTTVALENGLVLLDQANSIGGASRAIWDDRKGFLESLGRLVEAQKASEVADQLRPSTVRDYYLLGSSYARKGRYRAAINELKEALILNPRDYWSHFHLGMCFRQQNQHDKAAMEFLACTFLWPEFSWGYYNLGEALHHAGKRIEAIERYSAALRHEPEITQAYVNRGLVHLDLSEWDLALQDFEQARARGYKEDVLQGGRGIALAHLGLSDEADQAFARALATGPKNLELLLSYAFLFSKRRPEEARRVFLEVLEREPNNVRAMYGYGMLLAQQQRDSEEAAAWFDRAIKLRPTFVEALLARATVRAHQGRGDTALQDIDLCIALDPKGQTLYDAACFYALLAAKSDRSRAASWAEMALRLLGEAFEQNYGRDKAVDDSDLDGIRQHPKFRLLLQQATKLADRD